MDLWDSFWSALTGFISDAGLLAIAVIVLLRSAAIPIPVPADLLVVMVGVRAREQQFVLWPAWLVLSGSTTIGAALFYLFVRWIGHGDIVHYGHYVGLTTERINSAVCARSLSRASSLDCGWRSSPSAACCVSGGGSSSPPSRSVR